MLSYFRSLELVIGVFLGCCCAAYASDVGFPSDQELFASEGYQATEDGLRTALVSSNNWARIYALRIIRRTTQVQQYAGQVQELLGASYPPLRVEAAKTLAEVDQAAATKALLRELEDGKDKDSQLEAAGTLADLGITNGYSLVRSAFSEGRPGTRSGATRILRKFSRFKAKGIDVVPLLVDGMTKAIDQVETEPEKKPRNRAFVDQILAALEDVGDERALPVLRRGAMSKDSRISAVSQAVQEAIERKHFLKTKDKSVIEKSRH